MIPIEKIRGQFDQLARRKPQALYEGNIVSAAGTAWLVEALALVEATLGHSHATARTMRDALDYVLSRAAHGPDFRNHDARSRAAQGAFDAAKQIVDGDAIHGLIDIVRAATEADLLVQADVLLEGGAPAAAAVIAGGALETHLLGLIEHFGISWKEHGDRGIATYNNAIAAYRKKNAGAQIYSSATGDLILGWAKMRNSAAHEPLVFAKNYSSQQIKQMIDGIRALLA